MSKIFKSASGIECDDLLHRPKPTNPTEHIFREGEYVFWNGDFYQLKSSDDPQLPFRVGGICIDKTGRYLESSQGPAILTESQANALGYFRPKEKKVQHFHTDAIHTHHSFAGEWGGNLTIWSDVCKKKRMKITVEWEE